MELSWLITLFLGFILIYIMYWLATLNMNYWKNRGVPYMKGPLPFVGNSLPIFQQKQSMSEFALYVYNEFKNEKFFGLLTLQNPVFMPRDPELINLILIKNFNNFHDRMYPKNVSDIISDGLPNITGVRWRNLRYKLTPTFTSGKLKMMFNSIKESSDEIVLYIKEQKQNNKETEIELKDLMFKFIINVIGDVGFGIKINALNETQGLTKMFLDSTNSFFTPSTKQLIRLVIAITYPKLDRILKLNLIDSDTSKFFNDLVKDVIKNRKETGTRRNDFLQLMLDHQEKEQNNGGQEQTYEVEEPEDIELLKQLKDMPLLTDKTKQGESTETFTDNSIAAQTFTFISGGSDTTSNILTFALYELSLNQQVQRQLQKEIDNTLKNHAFNYLALKRMTYLEQVLYEVMRKYPPLAVVGRICTEEFHVPGTSIKLEKGIQVQIPVIGLHYDPQYFPDPETFNPDRFQDMEAIPKGVYLPFGGGPRMCIATRLAMLEMKILLATLLSTFNLTLNEKTEVPLKMKKNSMIIKAESGIFINFEERNPFK